MHMQELLQMLSGRMHGEEESGKRQRRSTIRYYNLSRNPQPSTYLARNHYMHIQKIL